MLVWLLDHFGKTPTDGQLPPHLTARIALAVATSFVAALLLGPLAIRWLKSRFRERIDSASPTLNELHAKKRNTPTMGCVFIVAAIVVATILWGDLTVPYVQIGLFVAITFGALGAADDWIKLSTARRGLTARQKFIGQWVFAA